MDFEALKKFEGKSVQVIEPETGLLITMLVDRVYKDYNFICMLGCAVLVNIEDINNFQYIIHSEYFMSDDCGYCDYYIKEVPSDYYFEILNLAIDKINQMNFGNSLENSYLTDFQRVGTWDDGIFSLLVKNNNELYVEYLCSEDSYIKTWLLFNVNYLDMLNYLTVNDRRMDFLFMNSGKYMKLTRVELSNGRRAFNFKTISTKEALLLKSDSILGEYDSNSPLNCETIKMKNYLKEFLSPDEKACGNCKYMLWNMKDGCICGYDIENSEGFNVDPKLDKCMTFKKKED